MDRYLWVAAVGIFGVMARYGSSGRVSNLTEGKYLAERSW